MQKKTWIIAALSVVFVFLLNELVLYIHYSAAKSALMFAREQLAYKNITLSYKNVSAGRGIFPIKKSTTIQHAELYTGNGAMNLNGRIPNINITTNLFSTRINIDFSSEVALSLINRYENAPIPDFVADLVFDRGESSCHVDLRHIIPFYIFISPAKSVAEFLLDIRNPKIIAENEPVAKGESLRIDLYGMKNTVFDLSKFMQEGSKTKKYNKITNFLKVHAKIRANKFEVIKPEVFGSYGVFLRKFGKSNIHMNFVRDIVPKHGLSAKYTLAEDNELQSDFFCFKINGEIFSPVVQADHGVSALDFDISIKQYCNFIDMFGHAVKNAFKGKSSVSPDLHNIYNNMDKNVRMCKFATKHVLANGHDTDVQFTMHLDSPDSEMRVNKDTVSQLLKKMDIALPESMMIG